MCAIVAFIGGLIMLLVAVAAAYQEGAKTGLAVLGGALALFAIGYLLVLFERKTG